MNLDEIVHFDKDRLNSLVKNTLEIKGQKYLDELLEYIIGKKNEANQFYSNSERDFIKFILAYCIIDYRDAKRKSGDYYAIHTIETAKLVDRASRVSGKVGDPIAITVAFLHDSIEEKADQLDFRADEYNKKIIELFEGAKANLKSFAKSSELLEEFKKEADSLVVEGTDMIIESNVEAIININEKLTRTPDKYYYDYIKNLYFPAKNGSKENTERAIIVKIADRINNTSDLDIFSDFHKIYSVYKNLFVIHTTRDKYYAANEKSTNVYTIGALDMMLKKVSLAVLEDIIKKLKPLVGDEFYKQSFREVMDYKKTEKFMKITEAVESKPDELSYTFDGSIYRYNRFLHDKRTIRKDKGDDHQVFRDALLMRELVLGYMHDPRFRLEGFEDIGGNGHNGN